MTKEEKAKLFYKPINGHDELSAAEEAEMNAYCEDYKKFLDASKTERECVFSAIRLAEKRGFVEYRPGMAIQPGDKVYYNNRGKAIMLAVIGSEPLSKGANIGAAHTDAPRLDFKPNPLYEDEMCIRDSIYFDDEGFLYKAWGHGKKEFRYSQIRGQRSLLTRGGVNTLLFVCLLSTSNLYPTPQTVLRLHLSDTPSSFSRRRLTWTSTVRLSPK